MALKALKKIITGSFELNQIQATVATVFDQLRLTPFLTGRLFKGQVVASTGTKLFHGLGAVPTGFIVTNSDGSSVVYRSAATADVPNPTADYIILTASSSVTADIWVF